ncbi:SIMPL domain-containing protein [bacterium]|nr:SIMPL domain-containing protein [bacterium]
MKKRVLVSALTVIALFSGIKGVQALQKEAGFISVSKSLSKEISPNQAEVTINVKTSDIDMKIAVNKNKQISNAVYSSVKNLLDVKNGDFVKTGEYSARQNYIYKDGKRIFEKNIVVNSIKVKTTDVSKISTIIDMSVQNGATSVDDVQFSTTNYENQCSEMLSDITAKAYAQANLIAHSAKSKVVGIKSISTSCSPEGNSRPYYRMMEMATLAKDNSVKTPIESGKVKLYANIDASFYVGH